MEHISKVLEGLHQQNNVPIETGISFLDKTIGGYYPGEMTTICGSELCCKTAFVIHQLCQIAIDKKIPTLLLLNYMSEGNFISSMIAYYCNMEAHDMHHILDSKNNQKDVSDFMRQLMESPLYIAKSGWYEDKNISDVIDNFVESEKIKIIFVDEVILDLTLDEVRKLSCMREIAVKKNIPVVTTCCIWNCRDGLDGIRPSITDLCNYSYLHGHDVVIGLTNYEQHYIFMDDKGYDLHGTIGLEILKFRGEIKDKLCYIPKDYFYYRDSEKRKQQKLEKLKESGGEIVGSLIKKFDLTIDEHEQTSF